MRFGQCFEPMADLLILLRSFLALLFKPRIRLEAEILSPRRQINILQRRAPKHVCLNNLDRLILAPLYRLIPSALEAFAIIKPSTVVCLHHLVVRTNN